MDSENAEKIFEYLEENNKCYYVNEIYLITQSIDIRRLSSKPILRHLWAKGLFVMYIVYSGVLLLINILFNKKINYNKSIAIARVDREKTKIACVKEEAQLISDDIKNFDFTVYRIGNRYKRLFFLFTKYIYSCIGDYKKIIELLKNESLAPFAKDIILMYVQRIPHTIVFKFAMEHIMERYKMPTIYIGATNDRFALISNAFSKKYSKKLICIPHGIESTVKMPAGYAGDVFYCSSFEMASKLNQLYRTSKFTFDDDVVRRMYRFQANEQLKRNKKVVFFTQPIYIEPQKKIIQKICDHLKLKGQKLYIKVHPLENPKEYVNNDSDLLSNFGEAIIGNLCISLSSTILLEALYNESKSVSIIHLIKDTVELTGNDEFLNDHRIIKPKDEIKLFEIIDQAINLHNIKNDI